MVVLKVSSSFGSVIAKELETVQLIADEEEKINSTVTAANKEESKAASECCCEISQPDFDGAADIDEPDKI